jgi:hypothetical protein
MLLEYDDRNAIRERQFGVTNLTFELSALESELFT